MVFILLLSLTLYGSSQSRPVVFTIDKVRSGAFIWTPAPIPVGPIGRVIFKVGITGEEITKLRDDRPRAVFVIRSSGLLSSRSGFDGRSSHSLEYK